MPDNKHNQNGSGNHENDHHQPQHPGHGDDDDHHRHHHHHHQICFTPNTLVRTPNGEVAVEDLTIGDLVQNP